MAVCLPIQKPWPLATTDCRWTGLAERAAITENRARVSWRGESGEAILRPVKPARQMVVVGTFILVVGC